MKKILPFIAILLLGAVIIVSCKKTKDGAPGPKGETGAPGASGYTLTKSGSMISDLSGTNRNHDDFTARNIKYQYFGTADDNIFYTSSNGEGSITNLIRIKRYDSTGTNFLMFEIEMDDYDTTARYIDFKYVDPKNNIAFLDGDYYSLPFEDNKVQISNYSYNNVDFTFDDFKFDPKTGEISFGYNAVYQWDYNSTGNAATLSGTVTATLGTAALRKSASGK